MASRNFAPLRALDREVVKVFGGGTGAANADLTAIKGAGVTSITYGASSGRYVINLADKFASLLMASFLVIDATTPDDWEVVVVSESVASDKTVSIAVFKGGTLTDLTTDEKLKFELTLSNTNQPPTAR